MDEATRRLIEAVHASPFKFVLVLTGGGTGAAAQLLEVPGGSRTLLEVIVPYGEQALADLLGSCPAQFCSPQTAQLLARRAWERAVWLAPGQHVIGLGCTASLVSDRPKRGAHRFHVTCWSADRLVSYSLTLVKGARARKGEEELLDRVVLNALAEGCGVTEALPMTFVNGEDLQREVEEQTGLASASGEAPICATIDGQIQPLSDANRPAALLPGAFNPIHEGHRRLAAVAERLLQVPVAFELSMDNVDKPPLALEEVHRRLQQFQWKVPVWVTRAPTFVRKAGLFPGVTFIVGADTAERIVASRYYDNGEEGLRKGIAEIRRQGCRFLVAGRLDRHGCFACLDGLQIPAEFRDLFVGIPEAEFRLDLSSTELRV